MYLILLRCECIIVNTLYLLHLQIVWYDGTLVVYNSRYYANGICTREVSFITRRKHFVLVSCFEVARPAQLSKLSNNIVC